MMYKKFNKRSFRFIIGKCERSSSRNFTVSVIHRRIIGKVNLLFQQFEHLGQGEGFPVVFLSLKLSRWELENLVSICTLLQIVISEVISSRHWIYKRSNANFLSVIVSMMDSQF